jgi:hypothetical protein
MQIKVIKTFLWAHQGITVKEYAEGSDVETDDADMVEVALAEGWATEDGEEKPKRGRKPKAE